MSRLLVALDGSTASFVAARVAASLAAEGDVVELLTIVEPSLAETPETGIGLVGAGSEVREARAHAGALHLSEVAPMHEKASNGPLKECKAQIVSSTAVQDTTSVRHSLTHALDHIAAKYDVVEGEKRVKAAIVGPTGHSALKRVLLGTTATSVLHHASMPVVVARDRGEKNAEPKDPRHFVVCLDGSVDAQRGLDWAASFLRAGDHIDVITCDALSAERRIAVDSSWNAPRPEARKHELRADPALALWVASHNVALALKDIAAALAAKGLPDSSVAVRGFVLGVYDARDCIIDFVADEHADLVVLGTRSLTDHGHAESTFARAAKWFSGMERAVARKLLGSVAEYVVTHAPCSVAIVP